MHDPWTTEIYIYIYYIYIHTHTEIVHANATHAVLASLSEDIQDQLPVHRRGSVACPIAQITSSQAPQQWGCRCPIGTNIDYPIISLSIPLCPNSMFMVYFQGNQWFIAINDHEFWMSWSYRLQLRSPHFVPGRPSLHHTGGVSEEMPALLLQPGGTRATGPLVGDISIPVAISALEMDELCIVYARSVMYWNFNIGVRLVILLLRGWSEHFIGQGNPDDF